MKNLRFSALFVFFALSTHPSQATVVHASLEQLYTEADIVALAETISSEQDVDHTQAQLKFLQVFKGPRSVGELVVVRNQSGRVYFSEDEAPLHTMQTSLVFLQKEASGEYRFVNQGDGLKEVSGKGIRPYHDNRTVVADLKDYLKALEILVKASQAQKASK